jgi:FkbM family methyltransferase
MATLDSFYRSLTGTCPEVVVVDVGANPIDGPRPYERLLLAGHCRLFGFEPDESAFARLQQLKGPGETYLPFAVADGERHSLHICKAGGMTSLLRPDQDGLATFGAFASLAEVLRIEPVETVRLDDVAQIDRMDLLKIDAQGSERMILEHGSRLLADCSAVQLEIMVVPMYENQPTFASLDELLRSRGLRLLRLVNLQHRVLRPATDPAAPHAAGAQLGWMDAIYVRDPFHLDRIRDEALERGARIAHEVLRAPDLAARLLAEHDRRSGSTLAASYVEALRQGGMSIELTGP